MSRERSAAGRRAYIQQRLADGRSLRLTALELGVCYAIARQLRDQLLAQLLSEFQRKADDD